MSIDSRPYENNPRINHNAVDAVIHSIICVNEHPVMTRKNFLGDHEWAFLMELDASYCDVIGDRYHRFTGKPAILERTGGSPIPMKSREENMR